MVEVIYPLYELHLTKAYNDVDRDGRNNSFVIVIPTRIVSKEIIPKQTCQ